MAYLTTTGSGQPVLILKEGTSRSRGKEAQRNNIMAARVIGEVLKTTLGPRGMDKMLIDSLGDITITNDGAAILNEIDVEHPAAKMMVEIAKTQDDMVGDGTTTAVVLASELLKKAEELLDQNIPNNTCERLPQSSPKSHRSHKQNCGASRHRRPQNPAESRFDINEQQSRRRR